MTAVGFEMKKPVLAIEGLTVSFDGFKAVDNLNLYIDRNEVRVVIGPNGAGKTTVLDLICGKTRATSGCIQFDGQELTKMREYNIVRAGVGRKFQNPSIYENLTVFENLEMSYPAGRKVWGALFFKRNAQVIARVEEVAREIFLGDLLQQQADLLSHGQKQWLEIGMLLMQDPELLMLDEPVAGMSAQERTETGELLRRVGAERTVVVVEHDMDFMRSFATSVTVLHAGKVLSEGTVSQVQADPQVQEVYLGRGATQEV
ncbi:MAG: urea ABC transporter ATP-binding protein UrtD [Pseudomonas sp.]